MDRYDYHDDDADMNFGWLSPYMNSWRTRKRAWHMGGEALGALAKCSLYSLGIVDDMLA